MPAHEPVAAWASIVESDVKRRDYQKVRGMGGFVRSSWDEVNEIVAAANVYTIKKHGPDRVIGFSPIPAMSMVSYAAGSRYLSLIGGVCMSFYDWYCDLPPSSPQVWGEQTDVPESADWYNSNFLMLWGSNVPQTRTPDAHFFTEVRYKGAKIVSVFPDYAEGSKFGDLWLHPKQGTDAALAMAMGHVILSEYHAKDKSEYFREYCRKYSDMPMLVRLVKQGERYVPDRFLRASDVDLNEKNNPEWKTVCFDEATGLLAIPTGSIGFRWGEKGKWNLDTKDIKPRLSLEGVADEKAAVAFPYFGGIAHEHFASNEQTEILERQVPVKRVGDHVVASVYDLFLANYGVGAAKSFDDDVPYTLQFTGEDNLVIGTGAGAPPRCDPEGEKRLIVATTLLESIPPLRKAPRGTSETSLFCTAASSNPAAKLASWPHRLVDVSWHRMAMLQYPAGALCTQL